MKTTIYSISAIVTIAAILYMSDPVKPPTKTIITGVVTNPKSDSITIFNQEYEFGNRVDYKNKFKISMDIDSADYFTFYDGNETSSMYINPGQNIDLTLDTEMFDETIKYNNSPESTFLAKKYLIQEKYVDVDMDSVFALPDSLYYEFFSNLEVLFLKELNKLSNKEFIQLEKENIAQMISRADTWKLNWQKRMLRLSVLPEKGEPGIDFTYPDNNNNIVSLSDFKGKYVYVDIWATWCGPCVYEIPFLVDLENKYHDKNIVFLSVSVDKEEDIDKWKTMLNEKNMGGVQLFASGWDSQISNDYLLSVTGIPRFLLFDLDGNVIDLDADRPSSEKIHQIFNEIL
mgnify:FL=1